MSTRAIRKARAPIDARFRAAPSKSATHRALVTAALADGTSTLSEPLDSDDTRATRDGLGALGVRIDAAPDAWTVFGSSGVVPGGGRLQLGDSGTSLRFLAAVAALGRSASILDGSPRLRERPIAELAEALTALGGAVALPHRLPLRVGGTRPAGGIVRLDGGRSSQFASALMLVGPHLSQGVDVRLEGGAVSLPYIDMTAATLRRFGVAVEHDPPLRFRVPCAVVHGTDVRIEGDHSSASYWLAAAVVLGGRARVMNLDPESLQPDARLGGLLRQLGCAVSSGEDWIEVEATGGIPPFDLDLGDSPDLVPTLAAIGLFAAGPCTLRGIGHLRWKESDRLEVLASNLTRLGRSARALEDRLEIGPPPSSLVGTLVATASDHRIAMAFAVAGLRVPGVVVDDAGCVSKSNPRFWSELETLETVETA